MANWSEEAVKILEQRYLKKDSTGKIIEKPDEMLDRVATFVASNEKQPNKWKIKFLEIMDALEFLPNSPTLMNAGRELGQLSACFVLPIEDDLSAIFEAVKQSALIHKTGGGTGFSFSKLRPRNSMVNSTAGVASGAVSFMHAFDAVTETVKQGGVRRGANLGLLNITHPDIIEFINCKKDLTKLQNFNISVGMNGKFLELVKNNKKHQLINPINKNDRRLIDAKELFKMICQNIWEHGEPGIIFLDTINKTNPIPHMGRIESTNPCVSGDTLVMVAGDKPTPIRELVGKEFPVFCSNSRGKLVVRRGYNCRKTRENQKLYKMTLDDGSTIEATEDHTFILSNTKKVLLKDLKPGDSLMRFDREIYNWHGCKYWKVSNGNFGKFEHRYLDEYYFGRKCNLGEVIHHKDFNGLNNLKDNLKIVSLKEHREIHDISGERNPIYKLKKAGKFEAYKERNPFYNTKGANNPRFGATVSDETKKKIGLKTTERFLNLDFRNKHSLAVKESMVEAKEKLRLQRTQHICEFCGDEFEEIITSEKRFCSVACRNRALNFSRSGKNHKVVSIEFSRIDDVYDLTVDEFLNYAIVTSQDNTSQRGLVIWDCGEQPLLPWESCNLGSIDISKFWTKEGIDFTRLEKVIQIAVRFLDNVIDVNKYPRIKIASKTKATRKIGLGIMGWADFLLKSNIKYNSDEAIKLGNDLMKFFNETAHKYSEELGKDKGYFPADTMGLKRRNATLTTIAPTGTLSMLSGCSSSIEPIFAKDFIKNVLGGIKLDISKKYRGNNNEAFVTALDVQPEYHIKMQAAFQQYTDNAVSKTINLSEDAPVEEISKGIYLAYELGCKGLTFYRYGTREAPIEITTEGLSECDNGKCQI